MNRYPAGLPTHMNDREWTDYITYAGPRYEPRPQPRPVYQAYPVFAACIQLREQTYGRDRNLWPPRDRYRNVDVDSLDGVPFVTLIEAARRAGNEVDAQIIEAAFKPAGGPP